MKITVKRIKSDDDATLSLVFVDNDFVCFGLEDEYREDKVAGETRIPAGKYPVELRTVGGFHQRYSRRFPEFHQGMLWIIGVPNFEYILIHIGNTEQDTAGCLLVGEGATTSGELKVTQSTSAYKKLYALVVEPAKAGNLTIEYQDLDRGFV
jgi:hypothetical protein